MTAQRLAPFGTSVFSAITALAERHGAINLAQGFPDFDGPAAVIDEGQTVTFARFSAPPSPRALDDLSATVRWLSPPMAAAS